MTNRHSICIGAAAVVAGLAACDRPRAGEIEHPLPGRFEGEDVAAAIGRDTVPPGMDAEAAAAWTAVRDAILEASTVVAIGTEGMREDDPEIFGVISDVAVGADGLVYVADEQAHTVKVFSLAGTLVEVLGGFGEGPADLQYPIAIELLADGGIFVLPRAHTLKVFTNSADGWRVEQVEMPFWPDDLCALADGRMYAQEFDQETNTMIRQVSLADERLTDNWFGEAYRDDDWLVRMQMSEGPMACANGAPPLVVLGSEIAPIIRAFDAATGAMAWASRLDDFSRMSLINFTNERGQSATRYGYPDEYDLLRGIEPVADGYLLVQVTRRDREEESTAVHSYLLEAASGNGAFIGDQLPRALPWANGYVALFSEPFPRLEVREYAGAGGR